MVTEAQLKAYQEHALAEFRATIRANTPKGEKNARIVAESLEAGYRDGMATMVRMMRSAGLVED
jgi:hypothetical protein